MRSISNRSNSHRGASTLGIQNGSVSLCRYRLLGGSRTAPKLTLGLLNELLEPFKAGPLKLTGVHKEEKYGFVRPVGLDKIGEEEVEHWDLTDCQVDDGFLLRMRTERRAVPSTLVQIIYRQRFVEWEKKTGKAPGPKERRELKDSVKAELMGKALPQIGHVDAFWRDRRGELLLFATGKKAKTTFEALFTSSFAGSLGLMLVRVDPPMMGLPKNLWEDSQVASETMGRLSLATPVAFAEHVYP